LVSLSLCFPLVVGLALTLSCSSSSGDPIDGAGTGDTPGGDPTAPPGTPPPPGATPPSSEGDGGPGTPPATSSGPLQTVFLIMLENHGWATIKNSPSASYIVNTLAKQGAHAEQYYTPPDLHPSEPNYIWLEAGDNLGITSDGPPADNHQATTEHLTTMLEAKGITWKAYAESIEADASGVEPTVCPLEKVGSSYDPKHTPQLYFDDVTNTNDPSSTHCKDHVKPYAALAKDLAANTVARYNFITPNLCNDMHGETALGCNVLQSDMIKKGDDWLAAEVPKILASAAYKNDGVLFVVWDEGDATGFPPKSDDGPIPLLVMSPKAKAGFGSNTKFTHSSLLRTLQEIFGVTPFLRGAATSNDLSELFTSFP
jgi:hypothetical protein